MLDKDMKSSTIVVYISALVVVSVTAYILGWYSYKLKYGYWHEVRREKSYPTANGLIKVSYITETIGIPFMDPGTSSVTLTDNNGLEFLLYKSNLIFQEGYPFVDGVTIEKNIIRWEDGIRKYELHIEDIEKCRSNPAVNRSP
jgi:hypothetical protein